MSGVSLMLGPPVGASPWAVFEELGARGYSIGIRGLPEGGLAGTATRPGEGVIHEVVSGSIEELAVQLAAWVTAWERS